MEVEAGLAIDHSHEGNWERLVLTSSASHHFKECPEADKIGI